MMKLHQPLILAAFGTALASCNAGPANYQPSPKAQQELARELTGRTAGQPQRCINNFSSAQMVVIDDNTLLFKDGRTTYVQHPRGGCNGLGIGGRTLVTKSFGTSQLCDGDINQTVDLHTGMQGGACVFGPFIPYTKPR